MPVSHGFSIARVTALPGFPHDEDVLHAAFSMWLASSLLSESKQNPSKP
jgi:hypothetical protein